MSGSKSDVGITQFFKIVVLGDSGVGKTALIQRLTDNKFAETSSTIGVQYQPYVCPLDDQKVQLQLWDTAGQERYRSISKAYFRNAVGALLVYDITVTTSFENLAMWLEDLRQMCSPNAFILLVGNKSDRESEREISENEAKDFALRNRLEYIEASALSGDNVVKTFSRLAFMISEKIKSGEITTTPGKRRAPPELEETNEEIPKCRC
ncbi:Ras-related protein Rab-14 [Tritrichomonas foetus]|uniref:Ras-related protein Rab-14 n=1 Tax=Tritrichomonas foetus TaxID=1144522 RepID=A0A1J4KTN9_9EUKA|nr:Ras-related protein Rab-14 [Tritrichomonas foetus]|eukprot:OHT14627.1 Ras-related protein Rab-14 [Tritrichomonas foetus]